MRRQQTDKEGKEPTYVFLLLRSIFKAKLFPNSVRPIANRTVSSFYKFCSIERFDFKNQGKLHTCTIDWFWIFLVDLQKGLIRNFGLLFFFFYKCYNWFVP